MEEKTPTKIKLTPVSALVKQLPTLAALAGLTARKGTNLNAIVMQEIEYLRMHMITKPDIAECVPESVVVAMKSMMRDNLSCDPKAGLVYLQTRNVKVKSKSADGKVAEKWVKILDITPSGNGKLSIARQAGRVLDAKRPQLTKDNATGRVTGVSIELMLPSVPEPRWETFEYDESDFERWMKASHRQGARNKNDRNDETLNYANPLYTSWRGGIDPEFARAKALTHACNKKGTNRNESRAGFIGHGAKVEIDPKADEAAQSEVYEDADYIEVLDPGDAKFENGEASSKAIEPTAAAPQVAVPAAEVKPNKNADLI